ncbi:MAG: hypothetical protein PHG66_03410 [Candidatus Colwellbacteria bacterium]|nr:hypothetical protein [Candidatus Colwellbacteria bacterium]
MSSLENSKRYTKIFIVTDEKLYDDLLSTWKGYQTRRVNLGLQDTFAGKVKDVRFASIIERMSGKNTVIGFIFWPRLSLTDKNLVEKAKKDISKSFPGGIAPYETAVIGDREKIGKFLKKARFVPRISSRYHWIGEPFGWGIAVDLTSNNTGLMRQFVSELATMALDLEEEMLTGRLMRAMRISSEK